MRTLGTVDKGKNVKIVRIGAGTGLLGKLNSMGIYVGDRIKVINNAGGPVIISRDNMRLAIGRGMSQQIYVAEEEE
ncbi:MAG: ferrous iron transport protein A [Candidatus Aureabacteria bacterium]|nr:ferrous iron transport protein A [Candidatus Auribacterota bacterium]